MVLYLMDNLVWFLFQKIKQKDKATFLKPYFDAGFQKFNDQLCWTLLAD